MIDFGPRWAASFLGRVPSLLLTNIFTYFFQDAETGVELETQEKISLLEWFANEYKRFGCQLEFITNRSQEGSQFCRGFGGIGGILRYQVNLRDFDEAEEAPDGGDSSDSDM